MSEAIRFFPCETLTRKPCSSSVFCSWSFWAALWEARPVRPLDTLLFMETRCWIGMAGRRQHPPPPTASTLFLPGGGCGHDPDRGETKPTSMNYYKLYPLEYKNGIFLVMALSLSPDKGIAERERSWYLNGGGCPAAWWAERGGVLWRGSAEWHAAVCPGVRNLARASHGWPFACIGGSLRPDKHFIQQKERPRGLRSSQRWILPVFSPASYLGVSGTWKGWPSRRGSGQLAVFSSRGCMWRVQWHFRSQACWGMSLIPVLEPCLSHLPTC